MEKIPYSQEEAVKEAAKLQEFIRSGAAKSYSESEALLELASKKERKFEKYDTDAGHIFEEMMIELLDEVPGITKTLLLSEYDDEKQKADVLVCFNNGEKLILQVSATNSKEKMIKKINELKRYPLITEIHDNNGKAVLKEIIPKAIAPCDKKIWGDALSEAVRQNSALKSEFIPNRNSEKIKLIEHIITSLELVKNYRQDYKNIFDSKISFLKRSVKELNK